MVQSPARTIVIVGAGFSGTVLAMNLLRRAHGVSLRLVLIDRARIARGIAYADREFPHLLNVPAGRMSASSDAPSQFVAFAQGSHPEATADDFLPRELYGRYLEWALGAAERAASPAVRLERVHGQVSRIERPVPGSTARVHLADGRRFAADEVVLALGNPPPARLPGHESLVGSPRYLDDPWCAPSAFQPGETVLVVGTGLTMADVVVAGTSAAREDVIVHAISRHGFAPLPQKTFRHSNEERAGARLLQASSHSARQLLRATRDLADEVESRGGDWREAITVVRSLAPALWQRMPSREARRFLRHARSVWDVHRHRLADATASALKHLMRTQRLHLHAGRVLGLAPHGRGIRLTWRARAAHDPQALLADRVINCTGPDYDARRSRDPLVRSLLSEGTLLADPLGLGLRTAEFGQVIDARRRTVSHLYYLGPMLRADHWEATAVPELRMHAERLAWRLLSPLEARSTARAAG